MKKSKWIFNLMLLLSALIFIQCGDDLSEDDRVYDFIVKDLFTNAVMPDVEVQLHESYGGSFLLDTEIETSDENGEIQFITTFNQDSVDQLIIENMNDPELTVWQPVTVLSDFFGFSSMEQNGLTLSFRNVLEQNNPVTLYSYFAARINLSFVHNEVDKRHSISVDLSTASNSDFFSNRGFQVLEGEEMQSKIMKFPANEDVKLRYEIREVDMTDWTETIILTDSIFITGSFMEEIERTVTF